MTDTAQKHSILSLSAGKRWMNCQASVHAISTFPKRGSGPEAREGTACHTVFENCLLRGLQAVSFVGTPIKLDDGGDPVPFTRELSLNVQIAVDEVRQLAATLINPQIYIEKRVHIRDSRAWGTGDVFLFDHSTFIVFDLKMGRKHVDVNGNHQCFLYTIAGFDSLPIPEGVSKIIHVIAQPRDITPGLPVRSAEYARGQVETFRPAVYEAERRIFDGTGGFNAGSWCEYCPALGECPATKDWFQKLSHIISADVRGKSVDDLKAIREAEPMFKDIIRQANAELFDRAMRGLDVGLPLITSSKHRQWTRDDPEFVSNAIQTFGYECASLITPAQFASLPHPDAAAFVKTNAVAPSGGPALGKVGDKRPAYTRRTPAEMFGKSS